MTDASTIAADPAWLPHRLDMAARQVEFLHIPRGELSAPGFLANRQPVGPQARAVLGVEQVLAMQLQPGPLHFIFHTAFCRSTLLVRALDIPGRAIGLNEPGIIASLAAAGPAGAPLVKPVLDLLSRSHNLGEVVFVKPTNLANRLVPALLQARPDSRAVLMTNGLDHFLRAIARRSMMGRRWGRQLYLELQAYAGMDFGMDGRENFLMTDLQAAGLAWFLGQRFFEGQMQGPGGARLRVLDGERFNAARAQTLQAVLALAGAGLTDAEAKAAAQGAVFASHAKLGGDFTVQEGEARARGASPAVEEEIAQVGQWIGMIAGQMGISAGVRHTLF